MTNGGMHGTLRQLIDIVERSGDRRYHQRPLSRGLLVEIGIGQEFNLRLSRVYPAAPSLQEWRTVLDYLPEKYKPSVEIAPQSFGHAGRAYLEAHWRVRENLI